MNISRRLVIRLWLSGIFGLCVALVPLYLVVGGAGSRGGGSRQGETRRKLEKADRFIADYRKQYGVYPPSLDAGGLGFMRDGWGRQFLYSLPNGKPLVESLGRDGVRGGFGLDADLSNINPRPPESAISVLQAVTDPNVQEMNLVALICGALSGAIIFRSLSMQSFERKHWLALGATFGIAFLVAALGAVIITAAHVPSGH